MSSRRSIPLLSLFLSLAAGAAIACGSSASKTPAVVSSPAPRAVASAAVSSPAAGYAEVYQLGLDARAMADAEGKGPAGDGKTPGTWCSAILKADPAIALGNPAAFLAGCSSAGVSPSASGVSPSASRQASSPSVTANEQQAIDSAQGYLRLGSGFSEEGLLSQLTSSYGSGFSKADAQFAISYLHPDWNAQAVEAARGYLKLGTGFSRASLIQQLTSSYGSGFTESQAEYAATRVGL